jgi:hypothetical protein
MRVRGQIERRCRAAGASSTLVLALAGVAGCYDGAPSRAGEAATDGATEGA